MKYYTVGQVNTYIKNLISSDYLLKSIVIKGEISNCKYHSMGHIYFSIKDETGSMPCVMFKGNVSSGLSFRLEDGMQVYIQGSIDVYERDGKYQLYARKIIQDKNNKGKLYAEYEKLKQKLNDEGLFDFEIKKPIPAFPKAVGIVTARTGAALQDIMNIAKRRNPYVQLVLYPAKVQGEGAAATIARGIKKLDEMGLDTIIIGRGGGSIEDLWAFNEEIVARAIYEAKTPIISGTGHEVDNTIADYAADMRAPTPSAAAELAIPDVMSTVRRLRELRYSIYRGVKIKVGENSLRLKNSLTKLESRSPVKLLNDRQQYLSGLTDKLHLNMDNKMQRYKNRLGVAFARLDGLSPTAKLRNGFGYMESGGKAVGSVKDVKKGDRIKLTLHDGDIDTVVD